MSGYLTQTQQTYYSGNTYGGYQYLSLNDIIDNFTATYVGEGKILGKTLTADVSFHAHRALAELSYDTLKSCKSQEIEVCPSLKMPLPQDYINYVKLTSVDANGIQHVLYPASKTSNPFSIEQTQDNCDNCGDSSSSYQYASTELKPQELECTTDITCDFLTTNLDDAAHIGVSQVKTYMMGNSTSFDTDAKREAYWQKWFGHVDQYCLCLQNSGSEDNCGVQMDWLGWDFTTNSISAYALTTAAAGWSGLRSVNANLSINRNTAVNGFSVSYTNTVEGSTTTSNTWDNYKSGGSSSPGPSHLHGDTSHRHYNEHSHSHDGNQFNTRYGLDPQYAQVNGSYFIDCLKGMIHFSSNLSGKTIVLEYISDSLGTPGEMVVPKLAEEAMYKWIAYGCASARIDIPEGVIQRLKKERSAETRKAKIRLSNIKIEEITQIMRGKSKFIKH